MTGSQNEPHPRSYDDWYRSGDAHWEDAPGKAVLVDALKRCLDAERPLRLLDIGCGTGSFLERLRHEVSQRWEYHGMDFAEAAIATGLERYPHLGLIAGDATSLPIPDASFDVVTCYGSWEHFVEPGAALAEAARVLAPGGWVLAMIPTLGIHRTDREDEGWYEDTAVDGCDSLQMQWNYRRETWARLFAEAGLLLLDDTLAASCGAHKPGVFYFGVRTSAAGSTASPIRRALLDLSDLAARMAATHEAEIEGAVQTVASSLEAGGKILVCGNGGSAADAQHFVAEIVGRLQLERPGWPAVSLCTDPSVMTAVANDYGYDRVFSRQVEALGAPGDVLLAISTSGRSPNVLAALDAARGRGLATIALLGPESGPELGTCDHLLTIPTPDTQRIQEAHTAVLHAIAQAVEGRLAESLSTKEPTR